MDLLKLLRLLRLKKQPKLKVSLESVIQELKDDKPLIPDELIESWFGWNRMEKMMKVKKRRNDNLGREAWYFFTSEDVDAEKVIDDFLDVLMDDKNFLREKQDDAC